MDGIQHVYGPRHHSASGTSRKAQQQARSTPLSFTFDPFVWDPPNSGVGGGAWKPPTPPTAPAGEGVVEITEGFIASRSRGASPLAKELMLQSRDKESLMEEIIRLKRHLIDQEYYLKRDKVHACTVQIENKKLENDIKDMESQGNLPSYKTQGSSRVRAKLQGMKTRYEHLQNICDAQHEEIETLRRDVRVTHTREIEVERDRILEEIAKLNKDVRRLKTVHSQLSCENKELVRVRDKADDLEAVNHHLENCMEVVNVALDKANRDVVTYKQKLTEVSLQAKRNSKRHKDLEEHIHMLREMLEREKLEKRSLDEQQVTLAKELIEAEQKLKTPGSAGSEATSSAEPADKAGIPLSRRTV